MKDSARTKQDDSTNPVERPTWRFTGRRGTPVHLRDQAPQTLPPEIRKAVTQLARERAGESAPAPDAKPVRAVSNLKLERQDGQAPPVAGAPMPVERRNRRETSEPVVATSHIPAATAPIAEATWDAVSEPAVVAIELPPIEAPVETAAEGPVELPATVDLPAAVEAPVDVPAVADVPDITPTAEAVARAIADATPAVEVEDAVVADADAVATPSADATPAEPAHVAAATPGDAKSAKRSKLTAAERKKLAKARAKAKAKAERAAKKDADGVAAADRARRLFARGRDVDAAAAATVEPTMGDATVEVPTAEAPATPAPAVQQPALEAPGLDSPFTDSPSTDSPVADSQLEFPAPDSLSVDSPLPPDVADLPDVVPSLDSIDDAAPSSFPALEPAAWGEVDADAGATTDASSEAAPTPELELTVPTSIADVDLGAGVAVDSATEADLAPELFEPALATETASQAAWELGRLPFLLQDPTPTAHETDIEQEVAVWDVAPSAIARPVRTDETFEPAAATFQPSIEPIDEPMPLRSSLQPIDWLPVGAAPTPAPIEPMDMPRRTAPDAIQRLGAPLEVPREDHSLVRAGAREGMTANSRTAEARRRISRRRAELDDLVESLAGLGSGRRDA